MLHRYMRLTAINQNGVKVPLILNTSYMVAIAERPAAPDGRPITEIVMQGCMFQVQESVDHIGQLMNTPDSMSGPLINPLEIP